MTDIKIENNFIAPASGVEMASLTRQPALAPGKAVKPEKEIIIVDDEGLHSTRKKTGGEQLVERGIYTGVGLGVNEALSLYIADEFEHGVKDKKLINKVFHKERYDRWTDRWQKFFNFEEKTIKGFWTGKSETHLPHQRAANSLLTFSLLIGGTLLILPMRWLTDNRASLSKKANHMLDTFGSKKLTAEEVKARDEEVERAIACEPKQSWPSLLIGRALAVGSTFAFGTWILGVDGTKTAKEVSQKAVNAITGDKWKSNETFQRYARLLGLETILCVISSVVLEVASKFAAKKRVNDPSHCAPINGYVTSVTVPQPDLAKSPEPAMRPQRTIQPRVGDSYAGMLAAQRRNAEDASAQLGRAST